MSIEAEHSANGAHNALFKDLGCPDTHQMELRRSWLDIALGAALRKGETNQRAIAMRFQELDLEHPLFTRAQ